MLELTDEERANGWTEKSLQKYLDEREKAQSGVIMFHPDHRKPARLRFANNRYNPLKWR